jgi:hypothetical protein
MAILGWQCVLALAEDNQGAGVQLGHDAGVEGVAMVLRGQFGLCVAVVELCPSLAAGAGVGFDQINLSFHGLSEGRQERPDFACDLRRDFNFELHCLAVGLGREPELALPVDGERARFA